MKQVFGGRMHKILTDLSPQNLTAANKANLFKFAEYLSASTAPKAQFHDDMEFTWAFTGIDHPFMNHVMRAQLTPEDADRRISETLASFKTNKVNHLMWWVEPDAQPENLGSLLARHGLMYSSGPPAMAVDLHTLNEQAPLPSGLKIEVVNDRSTLHQWCATTFPNFGLSHSTDIDAGVELYAGLGYELPMRTYLGLLYGKPVAGSQLFLGAGVAGIYCVATAPEVRGRGIGRALTLQPLREARAMGYRIAILQASPMGMPVYQRLGFQETAHLSCYLLSTA